MFKKKRAYQRKAWFNFTYFGPERRKIRRMVFMLLWIALYALIFYRFVVSSCIVEGESMLPTFDPGTTKLVNRFLYFFKEPQRGDVVMLSKENVTPFYLIKRVIGVPGEQVQIKENKVWINGKALEEPYAKGKNEPSTKVRELKRNEYFVLGDNREYSDDSRFWGPLNRKEIVGKVSENGFFPFW